jgi:hypothetical protein
MVSFTQMCTVENCRICIRNDRVAANTPGLMPYHSRAVFAGGFCGVFIAVAPSYNFRCCHDGSKLLLGGCLYHPQRGQSGSLF